MKALPILFASLILFAGCAEGGGTSGNLVKDFSTPASNAFVIVPADTLSVQLEMKSENQNIGKRLQEIHGLRTQLVEAASKIEGYKNFETALPIISSEYRKNYPSINLILNFSWPKDTLKFTSTVVEKLDEIELSKGNSHSFRYLSIEGRLLDVESHRPAIMEKLNALMAELKKEPSSKLIISLHSLESPLKYSSYGENQFIVSLPYTIEVESILDNAPAN